MEALVKLTPKQHKMIFDLKDVDEILYGGQAGPGKSEGLLMFKLIRRLILPGSVGLLLRRTFKELEKSLIRKSFKYYSPCAKWNESKKMWSFPNGSIEEFGYCENENDVYQYQSAEYDDIGFDELTHFTEFQYLYMQSRIRPHGPWKGVIRNASNPGNIGHAWVKSRFIDQAREHIHTDKISTKTIYFLPATLKDNTLMGEAEKEAYRNWLKQLPPTQRKQLEEGDWDYVPGAAFEELSREVHMIKAKNPPDRLQSLFDFDLMRPRPGTQTFRSLDWGYSKPFSVGFWFTDYDDRIYRFKEFYGASKPNEGIQLPARDLAIKIREYEEFIGIVPGLCIADASIWDKPRNQNEKAEKLPSIAETMAEEGVYFDRETSINAKKSRLQGKHQMHERLRVDADGLPGLFVFDTCIDWWRTIPALPLDPLDLEDVDTKAEDHAYDDTRYMLSARPYQSIQKKPINVDSLEFINKHFTKKSRVKEVPAW